jgi:hypothetical protein
LNNGEVKMNLIRELVTIAPDCECIKITYTLVGEEPVTVEVEKNIDNEYNVIDLFSLILFSGAWYVRNDDGFQATLSEDTPCPFGTYTIEEGSIFESFEVEPCY